MSRVTAVTEALEDKLKPEKALREQTRNEKGLAAWLDEISRATAPLMNDGRTSQGLFDELYDERTGGPE